VRIGPTISHNSGPVELIETVRGKRTVVGSQLYTTSSPPFSVKVKITSGDAASVWVEGSLKFNGVGMSGVPAGGVALASEKARFSALKVGYDNNADDDIDDGGDDLVVSNPFGSTAITPTHDP